MVLTFKLTGAIPNFNEVIVIMKRALLLQSQLAMPIVNLLSHIVHLLLVLLLILPFTVSLNFDHTQKVHHPHLLLQHLLIADVIVLVVNANRYLSFLLSGDPGMLQGLTRCVSVQ